MTNAAADFRRYLSTLMTERRYVKIQYFTDLHELVTINALLRTLPGGDAVSHLTLSTGETVVLDRLVSADGYFAPGYDGYQLYCDTCDC